MSKVGAPPKFVEAHVNWIFWRIGTGAPIGRKQLVKGTGLGEGSMRSILKTLDSYGLIKSSARGHELSSAGERTFKKMKSMISVLENGFKFLGKDSYVIKLSGLSKKVTSGMLQRDAAVKVTNVGVTTLLYDSGLKMPVMGEDLDFSGEYPKESSNIIKLLGPKKGDVIMIASDNLGFKREEAVWVAASTLLN